MKSAVAVLLLASVNADFSERWNAIKNDPPPPVVTRSIMTPEPPPPRHHRERRHARHHHGFVCHRINYVHDHHRYWRCRR
jgi:hypothetical protein